MGLTQYLLFKSREKWTDSQKHRAELIFELYPKLKKAYDLANGLRVLYNTTHDKAVAYTRLAHWYNQVTESGFDKFNSVTATIYNHYKTILNYFDDKNTNAPAELWLTGKSWV